MEPAIRETPVNMQTPTNTQTPAIMHSPINMQTPSIRQTPANMQAPANMQTPEKTMQMIKADRPMFLTSDDSVILKKVEETHFPDEWGIDDIDVKPLILIVKDIFSRANRIVDAIVAPSAQAPKEALEDNNIEASSISMLEVLVPLVDRISCELVSARSGVRDSAHETTMTILSMIPGYPWNSKLVLALSAFASLYGEFWHFAQSSTTNQLAKSVAVLKLVPDLLVHLNKLNRQFDEIKRLIKAMLDINRLIAEFNELPSDVAALSTAKPHIPMAVYWTIKSIVVCVAHMTDSVRCGSQYMLDVPVAWEFSSLVRKVEDIRTQLETQLNFCKKYIDEKNSIKAYQNLIYLSEGSWTDNMKLLKALLNPKNDPLPLHDGANEKRVNLDVLRRKFVLLLISDLDIPQEELAILEQIYNESRQHPSKAESQYEVVWFPILDPAAVPLSDSKQRQFDNLQANMPWYTVYHPSLIDQPVIRFVKERWHFLKKPILVVLDPNGQVVCPNALHMMWIWGRLAFPFTTAREEVLWKEETWRLELLVDSIDPMIQNWISEGRFICLYGGEDIEWIRKFTNTARAVAQAAGISLEMVYVGKSNPKERVRRNITTINVEKLSHCLEDLALIWFFWVRLESMWQSKNQLAIGRTVEDDPIMQQIMTMLSFDSSEGGWAVLSRGSAEMTKAKGGIFLTGLSEYNQWKEHVQPKGFVQALHDHLKQLHPPHHCNRLVLPGTVGRIPEKVVCSECGRTMERFMLYKCCD